MDKGINVCYAISDKHGTYAKILGTSIYSLLEKASSKVNVYVLHDETLTETNRRHLESLFRGRQHKLIFRDVSGDYGEIWKKIHEEIPLLEKSRLAVATFFRLLLGELFSEEKRFIYLDADTIVNMDITELWEKETAPSGLAAAPDVAVQENLHNMTRQGVISQAEYFNAGVLLIDMDKFRQVSNLVEKSLDFIRKYNPDYLDQDILNYFFPHSCILPHKYNNFVWIDRKHKQPIQNCIYHYVNNSLGLNMEDEFNSLFFKCFIKTPWCNEDFIGNLAKKMDFVRYDLMDFANACAGKRRIVIGAGDIEKNISGLLELKEGEMYIPFEKIEETEFKFNVGRDLLLIFLNDQDYGILKETLLSYKLQENVHFINMLSKVGMSNSHINEYRMFLDS